MTSSPLKKLVMKLACVGPEDRAWILTQLNSEESLKIAVLLDEVESLGLAEDPTVVASFMQESSQRSKAAPHEPHPAWSALLTGRLPLEQDSKEFPVADDFSLRHTERRFSEQAVPAALAKCLREQLAPGSSSG